MASSTSTLSRQHGWFLLPAIAKLARWRFQQMWGFLLVTWLGMLALVVLACAPPLFSRVAISSDLRAVATNSPDGQNIIVQVNTLSPTAAQVQQIAQQLDRLLKQGSLGSYLQGTPRLVIQTPPLDVSPTGNNRSPGLVLDGYDPVQAAQHATVVQGRLPQATTGETVEIALTQDLARNLGLHVGSIVQERTPSVLGAQVWTLHIVGVIAPRLAHDPFWLAEANPFGSLYTTAGGSTAHNVLAVRETVRSKIAALQTPPGKDASQLFWSYPFNSAHLDANDIPALSQQASDLDLQINNRLTQIQGVVFAFPGGSLFETLSNYVQQIVILEIVITFLLLLILAIILFLISILSDMLVERQAAIIATLRSRGATRRHVFGTFIVQGTVLSLLALLAGPLLAILLVHAIAQLLLPAANQQSFTVITSNPIQAALAVKWFAVIAVTVALFVMIVAISRSSHLDIVTLRRETSRTKRVPFWRRLNLDFLLALLILVGYVVYNYLWQSLAATQAFDPLLYSVLKIGGFVAPPLLVAAVLMLFLRLFPPLLHLATSLAAKKRSTSAVLAFAQMERAPRSTARIIVLLALAIAAACFLSTLMMTKQVRASDAATFAVGADFSGSLPASDAFKTLNTLKRQYSTLAGVQAATLGYNNSIDDPAGGDLSITAVDAGTYAHTALWSAQNSSQPLSDLAAQLVAHRADATTHNVVYALVDAALWRQFGLSPGASFTLTMNDTGTLQMHFIALAQVNSIPGVYDTPVDPESGAGLVVDYQSYATVYAKESGIALSPNYLWLRTRDDASSLAHIRNILPDLQDRRMLTTTNQENSVHIDIIGVLAIGVGAALILALIGTLLSSWLNASNRLTNFAIMRALGMAPRQVAAVLLWEQGFVYMLAFLLGTSLGALLTIFVAPAVSLLDLTGSSARYNPYDVPPVQAIIPYLQISLLLGGLVVICLVALLLMARIVSRPSISQTLRLNED